MELVGACLPTGPRRHSTPVHHATGAAQSQQGQLSPGIGINSDCLWGEQTRNVFLRPPLVASIPFGQGLQHDGPFEDSCEDHPDRRAVCHGLTHPHEQGGLINSVVPDLFCKGPPSPIQGGDASPTKATGFSSSSPDFKKTGIPSQNTKIPDVAAIQGGFPRNQGRNRGRRLADTPNTDPKAEACASGTAIYSSAEARIRGEEGRGLFHEECYYYQAECLNIVGQRKMKIEVSQQRAG